MILKPISLKQSTMEKLITKRGIVANLLPSLMTLPKLKHPLEEVRKILPNYILISI